MTGEEKLSPDALRVRIEEYLSAHTTVTLATVTDSGAPAAAAVFYVHDTALNLYFLSEEHTRHGANLLASPSVAATIQDDGQDWRKIKGLQMTGVARPAKGPEVPHAAALYAWKYAFVRSALSRGDDPEILSGPLARAHFWVLHPQRIRLIDNTVRFGFKAELILGEEGGAGQN